MTPRRRVCVDLSLMSSQGPRPYVTMCWQSVSSLLFVDKFSEPPTNFDRTFPCSALAGLP